MATAMEAYYIDNNSYTRDSDSSLDYLDCGDRAMDPSDPDQKILGIHHCPTLAL